MYDRVPEQFPLGVVADLEWITQAEQIGYDFIEGNLSQVALLRESSFQTLYALVAQSRIKPEVFSCLLPVELNVVGRGVNAGLQHSYLDQAFRRAKTLGARVVVFASAGARQVPEGWPIDLAWRQMCNFLRILQRHAADFDLMIALEPLSRGECNLLNTVSEATLLASVLQLANVRVLADTYHMAMEHEPLSQLLMTGALLGHVHTANALGRTYPHEGDGEDYKKLFWMLDSAGYHGRVSVEGNCEKFVAEASAAFQVLDAARRTV